MRLGRGQPVRRTPDLTPMVDVIFLLNRIISAAFDTPIIFGNVYELQASALWPRRVNGVTNVALSLARTKSHKPSYEQPMPTAGPFTAATSGLSNSMKASTKGLPRHPERARTEFNQNKQKYN